MLNSYGTPMVTANPKVPGDHVVQLKAAIRNAAGGLDISTLRCDGSGKDTIPIPVD